MKDGKLLDMHLKAGDTKSKTYKYVGPVRDDRVNNEDKSKKCNKNVI